MKTTLIIMAAGIGSRFGTGIKQLAKMSPNGEIIMDYSIYDAKKAAWEKIDTTVADGTVTGTFSSLSPVAFVVDKTTLTSATGTATSPATSATTVSAVAVLGLAAVAAAFGLKKKAVR